MNELDSREYEVTAENDDPRFVHAKNEWIVIQIIVMMQIFLGAIIIYTLSGNGKYVLGYLAWYAYGTLFYLLVDVVCIVYGLMFIRRSKLDAIADDEEEER